MGGWIFGKKAVLYFFLKKPLDKNRDLQVLERSNWR